MAKQKYNYRTKTIEINNQKVNYRLKSSSKANRLRFAVYCDGSIVVTKPRLLSNNIVEKFIYQKAEWILSKLDFFIKINNNLHLNEEDYYQNKEKALKFVKKRVEHYNKLYNFFYNKISIKNQKTRWGSCSKKRNLNFNYKIIFLDKKVADYIIVHELCHLKEFNHSRKFWNLIEKTLPDYLKIRSKLKNNL